MDVATIYRVYKGSVQRVLLNIKSINSHAAYLITIRSERQVFAWIGSNCESADVDLVNELGVNVLTKDFCQDDIITIPVMREGSENSELLEIMLDLFWTNSSTYFSKKSVQERKSALINNSVSVGIIEPVTWLSGTYDFQETAFSHPDNTGKVPRLTFAPIEMNTVAYVNIGDHWDIWISRAVSKEEEEKVVEYVRQTVAIQLQLPDNASKDEMLDQYIKVIRQGEELTLFRRPLKIFTNFEPKDKCAPRPIPAPKLKKDNFNAATSEEEKKEEEENFIKENFVQPTIQDNAFEEDKDEQFVDFWSIDPHAYGNTKPNDTKPEETVIPIVSSNNTLGIDINKVTVEMFDFLENLNCTPEQRKTVIDDSAANPSSLIGYQVNYI